MFKLIKVDHHIWGSASYRDNPSVGNHFNLYKFEDEADLTETLWELQCNVADQYGDFNEDEEDYADFVERNSDYIVVDYDPTNTTHALHPGYEDERPEHAVAVKAERLERLKHEIQHTRKRANEYRAQAEEYSNKAAKAVSKLTTLIQELEELNEVQS